MSGEELRWKEKPGKKLDFILNKKEKGIFFIFGKSIKTALKIIELINI